MAKYTVTIQDALDATFKAVVGDDPSAWLQAQADHVLEAAVRKLREDRLRVAGVTRLGDLDQAEVKDLIEARGVTVAQADAEIAKGKL